MSPMFRPACSAPARSKSRSRAAARPTSSAPGGARLDQGLSKATDRSADASATPPVRPSSAPMPSQVRLHFGVHKHMHQPYYNTTDLNYWDGEKEGIFGSRAGNYTDFIPAAIRQYIAGGLPHAGLSTSWSGSLIEQLDRCARDGLCGGRFAGWSGALRAIAREKTALGNPRCDFHRLRLLSPADGADPGAKHHPADRVAPAGHPRCIRRRGLAGVVPAGDSLSRANDPGAEEGRHRGGDLRFHPPFPRLPATIPTPGLERRHAAAEPGRAGQPAGP